jgi:cytochrome c-type biogenesis protein/peptide methionine sulfoxide reductase msrA/msrB
MRKRETILFAVSVLLLLLGAFAPSSEAALPSNPLVSAQDGSEIRMADLEGTPTILVFFSPLCPYCRTELKELEKLARWPIGQGTRIVAVTSGGFSGSVLRAVVTKWGLNRVEVFGDPGNALFRAFGVKKVPFTVYFDAQGNRKDSFLGAANAGELEEFLKQQS